MVTVLKPETSKITTKKVGVDKKKRRTKSGPTTKNDKTTTKKVGPDKKNIQKQNKTQCFDPLERRGIVDLGGVATGDGVQLVLKR